MFRAAIACVLLFFLGATFAFVKVDPASRQFVDESGRQLVFHGMNVVVKAFPYTPTSDVFDANMSMADEDIANMVEWGFNVVRLGVMWEAVEPVRGQYNMTYLAAMRTLVDRLAASGIMTIVDMHQDVLSRKYCGEGFPDWAIKSHTMLRMFDFPFPFPFTMARDSQGLPSLADCQKHNFGMYYGTFEVGDMFEFFFTDSDLQERFALFWKQVAGVFNSSSGVLGYELINEPSPGNLVRHPINSLDGAGDRIYLAPMYARLHKAIREVDDQHIIFYEPMAMESSTFTSTTLPAGGPGGDAYQDRQAFAYHIYCPFQNSTGDVDVGHSGICNTILKKDFNLFEKDRLRLGGGAFMTEFGALGNHQGSADSMTVLLDLAEQQQQSWAYWMFKTFGDFTSQNAPTESLYDVNGTLQTLKLKALTRPYGQAIAGTNVSSVFVSGSRLFSLSYNYTSGVSEVFVHAALHYPEGMNVRLTPTSASYNITNNRIIISHANVPPFTRVELSIFPKTSRDSAAPDMLEEVAALIGEL